ncbi:MAG: hypothetical protein QOE16_1618 [Microbacteriaceae bacterium]|nr:hypothetical protein [Microbacteriaceae bacterium]
MGLRIVVGNAWIRDVTGLPHVGNAGAAFLSTMSRLTIGGEWGIRTPEGFHPTRFPSVRHRPLGEFSGRAVLLAKNGHRASYLLLMVLCAEAAFT